MSGLLYTFRKIGVLGGTVASLGMALATPAHCAEKPAGSADADAGGDSLDLAEIVVTATPHATSLMKSSSSVSTLDAAELDLAVPNSTADVLRDIPGIHAEASAGEGNTNVTVRGIPISAGGFRYVSLQEDGLPVLLNGDYDFVTPDMFVKLDGAIDHVEAVRGGQASVLASNSPGAIINFISKTGNVEGGSVGLSSGLDYNENRFDFNYGSPLSEHTRFFVAGFFREGRGPRDGDVPIERGGQIKANLTHNLGDSGSFLRIGYKHLDDQTPLYMPVPFSLSNANPTKANPATIEAFPGIDPRTATYYSPYWPSITMRTADNNLSESNMNSGLTVREDSLTLQAHLELGDEWVLDDSFRYSARSGSFLVGYPTGAPFTSTTPLTYAAGPLLGRAYTGQAIELAAFNAALNDMGGQVNALKLTRTFKLPAGVSLSPVLGWDLNFQTVHVNQDLPHYLFTASGDQPVPLVGLNAGGVATDSSGLLPDALNWSEQNRQIQYDMSSPYLDIPVQIGRFDFDAGVREDKERVSGFQTSTDPASPTNPYLPGLYPTVPGNYVSYDKSHTSWSFGGNYQISDDLAVFVRDSDGVDFNVVERMGGPFIGGAPIPLNTVEQTEAGVKFRYYGFQSFVTFFSARTAEENYDVTTQILTADHYTAQGVEFEGGYHVNGFDIRGGFTYTNAKIIGSNIAADVGDQPHRLAKYIYQVSPSYQQSGFRVGGSLLGTAKSFGDDENTIIQPGFYTVNLFASYTFGHALVSLATNNVFNKIGWTEWDNGQGARSINGRTVKASLEYRF